MPDPGREALAHRPCASDGPHRGSPWRTCAISGGVRYIRIVSARRQLRTTASPKSRHSGTGRRDYISMFDFWVVSRMWASSQRKHRSRTLATKWNYVSIERSSECGTDQGGTQIKRTCGAEPAEPRARWTTQQREARDDVTMAGSVRAIVR